ncbi:glycosyltransferase [Microbacterium sp. SCN 69-37]|uniref:glycosyltransferase family 2 protein n=1 Tax=Microbacterium sp. SCN 69-37 TaxID=1660115 RepID=UPI000B18B3A1|nr:glycosyltransferase [Microbacterium sp. SCN 69-37]
MSTFDETATARDTTVIITCCNHASYVEQCLESVFLQTEVPGAVIVVDDLSTDDSVAVIRHWVATHLKDVTLLAHAENKGLCRSLNDALHLVRTPYLLHISADDWMLPARVATQIGALRAHPEAAFVASDFLEVDAGGLELATHDVLPRLDGLIGPDRRYEFMSRMLQENVVPAPAVAMRTSAVRNAGGWDESLVFEDYDMWLKLGRQYGVAYTPGVVTAYRNLPGSMSHAQEWHAAMEGSLLRILDGIRGSDAGWDEIIRDRIARIGAGSL